MRFLPLLLAFLLAACGDSSGGSSSGGDGDGDGDGDTSEAVRNYCDAGCACEGFAGDEDCLSACEDAANPTRNDAADSGCGDEYDAYLDCLADELDDLREDAEDDCLGAVDDQDLCADELTEAQESCD